MTGVITAVIRKREGQNGGYGFIKDEDGHERFFHANNLRGVGFTELKEGSECTFAPVSNTGGRQNGLRAEDVRVTRVPHAEAD